MNSVSLILSDNVRLLIFIIVFVICAICELVWPLRPRVVQPKIHFFRNVIIGTIGTILLLLLGSPLVSQALKASEINKIGLLNYFDLPMVLRFTAALLIQDYLLYIWHRMNHRWLPFWRFHNVHHIDLDLDISTASRFHFGELLLSSVYRAMTCLIFGINILELIVFETLATSLVQFNHSNIKLPLRAERLLNMIIVTPRMHGLHHSIVQSETDSNYGTIFTFWDRLHRTLNLYAWEKPVTIGVPSYRLPEEQTLISALTMPFGNQRRWELPDGTRPTRNRGSSV